jgi:hypothetical protein
MKRVLFISYYFPPIGGIGAERPLAFARLLPSFGWEPVVLAPSERTIPAIAAGAGMEIPEGLEVHRVANPDVIFRIKRLVGFDVSRNVEEELFGGMVRDAKPRGLKMRAVRIFKNWSTFPDRMIDWYPFVMREAMRELRSRPYDAIYTNSPPYTAAMVGARLQKLTGVPWVCDLSDIWTHCFNRIRTGLALRLDEKLEKRTLAQATRITLLSDDFAELIAGDYPQVRDAITVIPHGYDKNAFDAVAPEVDDNFNITYTGTVAYPHLDPRPLFEAIAILRDAGVDLSDFKFKYVGQNSDTISRLAAEAGVGDFVRTIPQVPYERAIAIQKGATALLYIQWEPDGEKATYSKFTQYIGSRRPILALAPTPGAVDRILGETGAGRAARGTQDVVKILGDWLSEYRSTGGLANHLDEEQALSFTYPARAGALARVLDEAAATP